ncbi:hypothetical protein AX17_004953 [Amanita inopinata Kibby_2008]|nr:hypothetical protein AX17_004953 [Amanita inopinata Kibby_2008]
MTTPNLPAVRLHLTDDGDCTLHDAVGVARPRSTPPASLNSHSLPGSTETPPDSTLNGPDPDQAPDTSHPGEPEEIFWQHPLHAHYPSSLPQFSRSLSMPTPSQLGLLRHPHRSPEVACLLHSTPVSPSSFSCQEISLELADSLQSVIQTMLQISPQQVLDPAKEQFSACTLSVPTPCMSAMFTLMKNLNYISANLAALCTSTPNSKDLNPSIAAPDLKIPLAVNTDFDVGELLQSVGDGLGGAAAQAGVDLVLYHGDVSLKHVCVSGDEDGLSYTLSHVLRQILSTAQRGDTIELGLLSTPAPVQDRVGQGKTAGDSPIIPSSPSESAGPAQFTFIISHKFAPVLSESEQTRPSPSLSTVLLRRLLQQIGATIVPDLPPPPSFANGRACELRLTLARGNQTPSTPAQVNGKPESAVEPTLDQLFSFAESLKGKKVVLYASSKGSFAQHFTSYLTAWGMDVNHLSPDGNLDGSMMLTDTSKPSQPQEPIETSHASKDVSDQTPSPTRFIVIDDDVNILKERLYCLRSEQLSCTSNRPSLSNIHRPLSFPAAVRSLGHFPLLGPSPTVVLHFTSLSNYKMAKDALQTVVASYAKSNVPAPEVMIIPKPAGPRRLLTALHTAVTKPVIDPFFLPIATSPQSPGIFAHGSFFGGYGSGNAQSGHNLSSKAVIARPHSGRAVSDRSLRSSINSDHSSFHPPSPLGTPDSVEYFSRAAYRLGGSPSSGLVIQSPDGQPAGIFFHPRVRSSRAPSTHSMERDKGQLAHPGHKNSASRWTLDHSDRAPSATPTGQTQPPAPALPTRSSSTTGVPATPHAKPIERSQSGPAPDQASTSSAIQRSSPAVIARTDPVRMIVQAVSSPTSPTNTTVPTRRSVPRRRVTDSSASAASSTLTLPTTKSSAKKIGKTSENPIVPPISVLIVDDNPINQTILSTFMKKKRIQYDIASNGQEAVEKWKTGVFHLILMDIQMPVMDGIEATKEIRQMEKSTAQALYPITTPTPSTDYMALSPTRTGSEFISPESRALTSPYHPSVIIVALTASSLQSDRVAALAAGCNDFLTKPVSLGWLNSKIIEWGSIKALQMWADLRPNVMRSITHGQAAQARSIAERLHMPKSRNTPNSHVQASSSTMPRSAAAGDQNVATRVRDGVHSSQPEQASAMNVSGSEPSKKIVKSEPLKRSLQSKGDLTSAKIDGATI